MINDVFPTCVVRRFIQIFGINIVTLEAYLEGKGFMMNKKLRFMNYFLSVCFIVSAACLSVSALDDDPDPNSPTPVLLSAEDSTRALAIQDGAKIGRTLPRAENNSFELYSRVVFFVTNMKLMNGEGANALRFYAEDANGRHYMFPVSNVKLIDKANRIYAVSVELRDTLGYWGQPTENKGDILVSIAWRGLESNRVRLGLGGTGGNIKDDANAVPTPFSAKSIAPKSKEEDVPTENYVGYRWSGDRIRFLEQATFGPTQALDDRLRRIGLRTWLAEQFEAQYPSAAYPYPDIPLKNTNQAATDGSGCGHLTGAELTACNRDFYSQFPVQAWFYKHAFYGDSQLRHRVAWSLGQIWVISGVDTQQSRHMIEYHKVLSNNAFGNWRTLMSQMTLNPGMGNYLDMARSTRTNPNENYAREILQLFNVGLFMLNQDGTLQLDGNNQPIPTYTQDTVNNFTKVFTGFTFCEITGAQCPNRTVGALNYIDPLILTNTNNHDLTTKTLLTYPGSTTSNVAACTGCNAAAIQTYATNSMNQALDNIYNHPNTAPFVSRLLIQQLVTGEPTPAYVGRVAAVFNANRNNPTQMKEVIKAILLDPEARGDNKTDSRYGKLREPVQLLTNVARQFDVLSADRTVQSDGVVTTETAAMGQTAFMSPTVFNYFPPDYVIPGTTLNSPEFGVFTTGTSIARANFGNLMVFSRININAGRSVTAGTSIDLTAIQALSTADATGNLMLDELNRKLMHGTMSPEMRNTIRTAVLAVPSATAANHLLRAQTAMYLILTSSQYQVQR